ncbi:MAG: hypothetical protein KKA99_03960 [Gammaproteobacteria bacterium]|nr:hypothetical protein [Gammaproteobacteria bacterium]MBU1927035.1 hypothetical protein [Gammaproteobacteria bacterium]MBU2545897.1 hypothetical protein [Gammaproteobacteria bacterium]
MAAPTVEVTGLDKELLEREEKKKKDVLKKWWERRVIDDAKVAGHKKNQPSLDSLPKAFQAWLDLMFHLFPMFGDALERTGKIGVHTATEIVKPGMTAVKAGAKATYDDVKEELLRKSSLTKIQHLPMAIMVVAVYAVRNVSAAAVDVTALELAKFSPVFKNFIAHSGKALSTGVAGQESPTFRRGS